jgi:thiamine biosynthesis lipoprotein
MKIFAYIGLILLFFPRTGIRTFHLSGYAQGTTYHVTYFNSDSIILKNTIDSIFASIDSSLSIYKPYSTIQSFNNSERGVIADKHLKYIIQQSQNFTKETGGLSDITVGPLTEAWGFGAKKITIDPTEEELKIILSCVGSEKIILKNDSLIKTRPCVKIDVNGIAQGYTVDIISKFLDSKGVADYLVEVGGELRVKGKKQPGDKPFQVGIESPSTDDFSEPPMQQIIKLNEGALTTSGNYRKYHESKGKKHSHILDPHTGNSVDNEMISATVFAKDATTADALDNALMLMGVNKAMKYIEERPDLAAFLIYKDKDGKIADTASSRFRQLILRN